MALYGGTFDPPHHGHVAVARAAARSGLVDEVRVVPAGQPWQKPGRTPAQVRLALAELAFAGLDTPVPVVVDDREVVRAGPSYTLDTATELAEEGCAVWLVVGADAAMSVQNWYGHEQLRTLLEGLLVVPRGATPAAVDRAVVLDADAGPWSSSDVRSGVVALERACPPAVADEARARRLYPQAA